MQKKTVAISIGDINGVGIEIALNSHKEVSKICSPIYCINKEMLNKASSLLDITVPKDFKIQNIGEVFEINIGKVCPKSGKFSYDSFMSAIKLCETKKAKAVVTMPIHKESWMRAGVPYKGHTDLLRDYFKQNAIMMLGCDEMYVALYTEHIALKDVAKTIKKENLINFMLNLHKSIGDKKVGVLGLNPHSGDNGVLGDEDKEIIKAIEQVNKKIEKELFFGAIVPDTAFTPNVRKNYKYFIAMYHDQGLAPLKALYFDESINISLNLPIIRTSVDHGTAFDIAYKNRANTKSYINAVKSAISLKSVYF